MIVEELINELEKIDDKTRPIHVHHDNIEWYESFILAIESTDDGTVFIISDIE